MFGLSLFIFVVIFILIVILINTLKDRRYVKNVFFDSMEKFEEKIKSEIHIQNKKNTYNDHNILGLNCSRHFSNIAVNSLPLSKILDNYNNLVMLDSVRDYQYSIFSCRNLWLVRIPQKRLENIFDNFYLLYLLRLNPGEEVNIKYDYSGTEGVLIKFDNYEYTFNDLYIRQDIISFDNTKNNVIKNTSNINMYLLYGLVPRVLREYETYNKELFIKTLNNYK